MKYKPNPNRTIEQQEILNEYHDYHLSEYKKFVAIFEKQERDQQKLLKRIEQIKEKNKLKQKNTQKKKLKNNIVKENNINKQNLDVKRKIGRPRTCVDYYSAMAIVRSEKIGSADQYKRWFQVNNPARMPKYPNRAYKKEWTGWGDFLGVYNDFKEFFGTKGKSKYISFDDARRYAVKLKLKNIREWFAHTEDKDFPKNIPSRPDIIYNKKKCKQWISWKHFLGKNNNDFKTIDEVILETSPILYIAKKKDNNINNVYIINVIPGGKNALIDHSIKMNILIIDAYYVDSLFDYKLYLKKLQPYTYGKKDEYEILNIYEVLNDISLSLKKVI